MIKPILVFYVQATPIMTQMEVAHEIKALTDYIEYQRKNESDFDFFVIPRNQEDVYSVEILNPVTVTEKSYIALKTYAQNMVNEAISKLNSQN